MRETNRRIGLSAVAVIVLAMIATPAGATEDPQAPATYDLDAQDINAEIAEEAQQGAARIDWDYDSGLRGARLGDNHVNVRIRWMDNGPVKWRVNVNLANDFDTDRYCAAVVFDWDSNGNNDIDDRAFHYDTRVVRSCRHKLYMPTVKEKNLEVDRFPAKFRGNPFTRRDQGDWKAVRSGPVDEGTHWGLRMAMVCFWDRVNETWIDPCVEFGGFTGYHPHGNRTRLVDYELGDRDRPDTFHRDKCSHWWAFDRDGNHRYNIDNGWFKLWKGCVVV